MPSPNTLNGLPGSAPGTVVNKSLQRSTREDFRRVAAQKRFLACFSATLNASRSSRVAKIDRQQHYRWLRDDPTYPGRFKEAMQMGIRTLEDHAVKLAHEGVKRMVTYKGTPVVFRGQIVYETEFDSQLIMFLLKNYDRKRFGDKIDTTFGPNWNGNLEDLPEELLKQIAERLEAIAAKEQAQIEAGTRTVDVTPQPPDPGGQSS